ncbi:hypothetical protein OAT10_00440 [Luminiphilus sp.]|nr:hypothetical protein [Luminiphilus sp.]
MSKRNNSMRAGSKGNPASSPAVPEVLQQDQESPRPKFSFAVPTEIVELPSKGRYYPEDHPLYMMDSVEIRYMTAKDEDTLTSKTLLNKGVALDRFLQGVIVDQRIKINTLLTGDKNALLVASRITGYGADYNTKVQCPNCSSTSDYSFNLNFCKVDDGSAILEYVPYEDSKLKKEEPGMFSIILPVTGFSVKFKLLNGHDENTLVKRIKTTKEYKKYDTNVTTLFKTIIVSVEGSDDRYAINEFIENMPAADSRHLRKTYEVVMPKIDMTQTFICEHCGEESRLEVPLTAEFFWPK